MYVPRSYHPTLFADSMECPAVPSTSAQEPCTISHVSAETSHSTTSALTESEGQQKTTDHNVSASGSHVNEGRFAHMSKEEINDFVKAQKNKNTCSYKRITSMVAWKDNDQRSLKILCPYIGGGQ